MRIPVPTPEMREQLMERATALEIEGETSWVRQEDIPRATAMDIYRAVEYADPDALALVMQSIRHSSATRRRFDKALRADATVTFAPLRAASTDPQDLKRTQDGYGIDMGASSDLPGHVYVLITVPDDRPVPQMMFIKGEDIWTHLELADPAAGIIQMFLPEDHPAVVAYRSENPEIILR